MLFAPLVVPPGIFASSQIRRPSSPSISPSPSPTRTPSRSSSLLGSRRFLLLLRREGTGHEDGGVNGSLRTNTSSSTSSSSSSGKINLRSVFGIARSSSSSSSTSAPATSNQGSRHVVEVVHHQGSGNGKQGWVSLSGRDCDAQQEIDEQERIYMRQQRRRALRESLLSSEAHWMMGWKLN